MAPVYEATFVARVPVAAGPPALAEVEGVTWTSIQWGPVLNAPDVLALACPVNALSSDVKTRLRELHVYPTELWITRNNVLVAAGPIIDWHIQGPTIQITGMGLLGYLGYMIRETAYAASTVDQALIVKQLIDEYQALEYGHYGIGTASLVDVGVDRSLTIPLGEFPVLLKRLNDWLDNMNGMDWWVDPATREMHVTHPHRGADLSATVILDSRIIRDNSTHTNVAPGRLASEGFASSVAADGATAVIGTASNPALRETFGRAGVAEGATGISEQLTIDGHAEHLINLRATPIVDLTPGDMIPVTGVDVGDFDAGDTVAYVYDAGLGLMTSLQRVAAFNVSVTAVAETMGVRFV